ncbi:apolipoprotein N-acyltransferase [Parasphingopyxis sp. CP4]|uniref:apolipoprotein N-acyltransferase n=1 Tax=Parasphingopyxis sp. CP4 TaxID=2724527 RepID=UPI00159F81C0|nr:apolipoprotein N-acyltransferase [Parasphingopyxis sp. CP4]QLC22240.1 apolipoprotein N-acyltransferase [Parasphingopyxis sp. CP4]
MLIALGAGALSATGFAPLGLWPMTLAAFAVLIALTLNVARMRTAFATGYVFGLGHFIVGLNWMAGSFAYQSAMPAWLGWVAVIIAALYLSLFPGLATALAWRIGKAMPVTFVLLFAATWIATEFLRASILFDFAWNPLAAITVSTLGSEGLLAPSVRIVGTYGLSGLLILLAGAIFLIFHERRWPALAMLVGIPLVLSIAGWWNLPLTLTAPADANRQMIQVIQPNIDQAVKWDPAFAQDNFERLAATTGEPSDEPRLIFWPEAAVPEFIEDDPVARLRIASLLGEDDILLLGATKLIVETDEDGRRRAVGARNSLYAMDGDGEILARYDKANLVHFGEYLPLRGFFEAVGMSRLAPGDLDFWPGPGPATLDLPGFGRVGGQICYEIIFSGQVVDRDDRPDFLFNPSNDAWFGAWGPPQHLAQARLRAVEEGLPVIRSTPTGISAVIDARGYVVDHIPYQEAGMISSALPAAASPTVFARYGNLIPLLFALLLCGLAFALMRRPR